METAEISGGNAGSLAPADADTLKQKTARLSIASNTFLVFAKLGVGIAIGSVGIISEAIHSGIDLVAALIAYFAVRRSSEPPDQCHTFGHGKYESVSGLIEALLIFVAALLIINEAVTTLITGEESLATEALGIGIGVMALSAVINWFISARLMRVAKETESIALESDAWHLRTDVYTSLGVFAGLVLIRVTGLTILDPLVALGVAVIILKAAFDLTRRSLADIIDRSLPPDEEARIRGIICDHCSDYVGFHALRTRRSGPNRFIDLHLVVARGSSVEESFDLVKHLESDLKTEFPRASVTIRVEPCSGDGCASCDSICPTRKP
ncbi:cation transporter [Methanoculleus taiwanensis]|uniref:Cation transporter n=1 Tax=Methanoculleus taiwanensis TaxID=1550565 RepID=A0A498H2B7_9EURY|nr:cation diffusion facilitator family transporter [Methanoculleus taiwanensis]RXE57179.1 cation transporter [Methanoculleus taiwanensis]